MWNGVALSGVAILFNHLSPCVFIFTCLYFIKMSDEGIVLSKDAQKILDLVKNLSVIELNGLVKALEEEFGVSAAAPVMVAGG